MNILYKYIMRGTFSWMALETDRYVLNEAGRDVIHNGLLWVVVVTAGHGGRAPESHHLYGVTENLGTVDDSR